MQRRDRIGTRSILAFNATALSTGSPLHICIYCRFASRPLKRRLTDLGAPRR